MKHIIKFLPAVFPNDKRITDADTLAVTPYLVPAGATFPDGTPITAYLAHCTMVLENDGLDPIRVYAWRFEDALVILARADEPATAAATLATAQVDDGINLNGKVIAYPVLTATNGKGTSGFVPEGDTNQ